ncbi:MAG: anthranilate synthase component I family protein [Desulfovibrio sp.]|nr:anthranilate synthase component I family protein [Desulfovibrio sp.]
MNTEKGTVTIRQRARWLPADMDTPISLWLGMVGSGDGILLESAEVDGRWGRYSVLGCDMALIASCREGRLALDVRDERFAPLRDLEGAPFVEGLRALIGRIRILPPEGKDGQVQDLPPITRALYGYFGFGMAGLFQPALAPALPPEEAEGALALPGTVLLFDHLYHRLCEVSLGEHREPASGRDAPGCAPTPEPGAGATAGGERYKAMVRRIRELLRQGEAIQVVPSNRFATPFAGDAFDCYRRLRRLNASPYMFCMRFPGITLFGSSPEVMVRCEAGKLTLSPIAGTRRRGRTDAEDEAMAAELLADPKERAEHVMLVDLGRNDLGRMARPGSVTVERFMEVERFSHVMHLTSRVTAVLGAPAGSSGDAEGHKPDAVDVLAAAFPAGTVSGAPKRRAMEIIRELEGEPRGPYAGCIGWIGLGGADKDAATPEEAAAQVNLDMGIAIRCMWQRDGQLFWQAGGGIVHDSDPELEWKEVLNKSAIMRAALACGEDDHVPAHR